MKPIVRLTNSACEKFANIIEPDFILRKCCCSPDIGFGLGLVVDIVSLCVRVLDVAGEGLFAAGRNERRCFSLEAFS